jgi:cell division protein FtsX
VLLFRPAADVASTESAIQTVIASGHFDYPRGWFSIAQNVDATLVQERMLAALSGFLAVIALLLAFVGVHGLISFSVTQRARELGIRLALGATPARLRRMVVREGLVLGASGAAIGVICAIRRVGASWCLPVLHRDQRFSSATTSHEGGVSRSCRDASFRVRFRQGVHRTPAEDKTVITTSPGDDDILRTS